MVACRVDRDARTIEAQVVVRFNTKVVVARIARCVCRVEAVTLDDKSP